jgi:protease I
MTADRRKLEGKRAVILTADEFEDMELFFPLFRLLEEGVEVTVAAPSKGTIHGEAGYSLEVDTTIDEIDPADFDLLIIPGGSPTGAPATVRDVPKAREIAIAFFAANKLRAEWAGAADS